MNLMETVCENADWIHLSQDRDQCLALMNVVMDIYVPKGLGISGAAEGQDEGSSTFSVQEPH
jgi:hypothetical protein